MTPADDDLTEAAGTSAEAAPPPRRRVLLFAVVALVVLVLDVVSKVLVALVVVVVIVRTAGRMRSTGWAVSLALILGGAVGNLVDRIFREPGVFRGRVVDWISLFGPDAEHWPIFNLADSAIVCGAILAMLLSLFGVPFDGVRRPASTSDTKADEPSQ